MSQRIVHVLENHVFGNHVLDCQMYRTGGAHLKIKPILWTDRAVS